MEGLNLNANEIFSNSLMALFIPNALLRVKTIFPVNNKITSSYPI
jgi:hypothetical protein